MNCLDGQCTWDQLYKGLQDNQKARYFRMNTTFDADEPAIDDVDQMEPLILFFENQQKYDIDSNIIKIMIATQFYFELCKPPTFVKGVYPCTCYIRCRSSGTTQTFLIKHIRQHAADFYVNHSVIVATKDLQYSNGLLQ